MITNNGTNSKSLIYTIHKHWDSYGSIITHDAAMTIIESEDTALFTGDVIEAMLDPECGFQLDDGRVLKATRK